MDERKKGAAPKEMFWGRLEPTVCSHTLVNFRMSVFCAHVTTCEPSNALPLNLILKSSAKLCL
jgi:hypothetical protein